MTSLFLRRDRRRSPRSLRRFSLEPLESRIVLDSTLVFNEIMYHTDSDNSQLEWVELYNQMSINIDLTGWQIDGGISYEFPHGTIVPPDDYLVVAANPQELENQTGFSDSLGPFTGQLSNSGEELRLLNNSNRVMNRVDYRDGGDWPVGADGSGFSLAKQDKSTASSVPANWTTSLQNDGTPGALNFVPVAQPTTEILVDEGDQARLLVPTNNSLGSSWTESTFDDNSWTTGPTAIGYDVQGENILAYGNLTGAPGTSSFSGSFGHDFDVNSIISITQLGVFDSGADGLSRKITAEIWSRSDNSGKKLTTMEFTSSDPGTLVDSNRFKPLQTPVVLDPGSYSVVAYGYGFTERAGHEGFAGPGQAFKTLNDGGGLLSFVGTSRLGTSTGSFPTIVEAGNVNYYSAGTFQFVNGAVGSVLPTDIEAEMHSINPSAYVRIPFTLGSLAELQTMTLNVQYNDGLVAYLNGQEIARRNAPAVLDSSSPATASVAGVAHELIDVTDHLSALQKDSNVLAIHGLNDTVDDNQFHLLPKLSVIRGVPEESQIAINEVGQGGSGNFFVEIQNESTIDQEIQSHILVSSSGQEYVFPNQTIAGGGYLGVSATELGFTPEVGERLFLFTPDRIQLSDARQVTGRLRGRSPDHDGRWLYPDTATPGSPNSFGFHDDIVINEIMYHPFGEVTNSSLDLSDSTGSVTNTLVSSGAQASTFIPSDNSLANDWQLPGFSDTSWMTGPTGVGFDVGGASDIVAYGNLAGGAGGSPVSGMALGHDFVVNSTITVTSLGVFDSGADGLSRTLTSELWSRSESGNDGTKLASLDFTSGSPGTLIDSNRFKSLDPPLFLEPGDYTIVAYGYGSGEKSGHEGFGGPGSEFKTLDDGGGAISFVGSSRLGTAPGNFPSILESGSVNYYSAGTFQFGTSSSVSPLITTDVESTMHNNNASSYTRVEFSATAPTTDESAQLTLNMKYDDGFIAYLNGTEVARRNAPLSVTWNSSATTSAEVVSNFETIDISAHATQLVSGQNVLAIHGLNQDAADNDFLIIPELKLTTTPKPGEDWLELYNRGTDSVDLTGWKLAEAVDYNFPAGTTIDPGGYLVVARDAETLAGRYPEIDILGNFSGRLSNRGERVQLLDPNDNPADEVHYHDAKPWPGFADAGRSSLELRDANADNSRAEAWAASDESVHSNWETYTYRGVAGPGDSDGRDYHELVIGTLDSAEILLDDITVISEPDGNSRQLIQNSTFDTDTSKWRIIGNHHGTVVPDPDNPGNNVLHLSTSGVTNDIHNHAETTLKATTGFVKVSPGKEFEISFRAKWLGGSNLLNTRLYFFELQKTHELSAPSFGGTPGVANSQMEANIGPTFQQLQHFPVVPHADEQVTVSVVAEDPDGVSSAKLYWTVQKGAHPGDWNNITMGAGLDGKFTGIIPGESTKDRIQFYVEAVDSSGATSTFPKAGQDSRAMYVVQDNQAKLEPLHNLRIIMAQSDINTIDAGSNLMSNDRLGATVIINESEVFYDVGVRRSGASSSRQGTNGYSIRFHADKLFRGVHDTLTVDRNNVHEILVRQLMVHAGDVPAMYNDVIRLVGPSSSKTGYAQLRMARFDDVYLDSQYENGSEGTVFEKELTYRQSASGTEGLKAPFGYSHPSELNTDIRDYGPDKETYRWHWLIKNHRSRDDYSQIVDLNQAFSLPAGSELEEAADDLVDIDQWMRTFAAMRLFGNRDFYSQSAGGESAHWRHNFQIYVRPSDNKLVIFPWDIDENYQISSSSTLFGVGTVSKVIQLPKNLRLTYGHYHDLIENTFNSSIINPLVSHLSSKLPGIGFTGGKNYIQTRTDYVLSKLPDQIPFEITTNGGADFSVTTPAVTLSGNAWHRIKEIFIDGRSEPLKMTWTTHKNWTVDVPLANGANVLKFQGYDFQGNLSESDSITVTTTAGTPSQQGLRISELHYNPYDALPQFAELNVDNDEFEFVEIVNTGAQAIDLAGAQLVEVDVNGDAEGVAFTFAAQTLNPNERIVVVDNVTAFQSRFGTVPRIALGDNGLGGSSGQYGGKLSNNGERITLLDGTGALIQQFDYNDAGNWPGRADGNGSSLEVKDTAGDYNDPSNWQSSIDFGGSPAAMGSTPEGGVLVNEVLANSTLPLQDTIELVNMTRSVIDVSGWYLSDSNNNYFKYAMEPSTTLAGNSYLVLNEEDFNPGGGTAANDFSLSSFGDDVWLWSVDSAGKPDRLVDRVEFSATLEDTSIGRLPNADANSDLLPLATNSLGSANLSHRAGELVVSEAHYNPAGADAGLEFLELFNASANPIDLSQWRVNRAVDFDLPAATLNPGQTVVLVDFDPALETAKDATFRSTYGIGSTVTLLGPWQATDVLDDGGEKINLERRTDVVEPGAGTSAYIVIDQVAYDDVAPWPTSADAGGNSLTRNAAGGFGNDPTAWTATTPNPGAFGGSLPGDFNSDSLVNATDIDLLFDEVQATTHNDAFDLTGDGQVNSADTDYLVRDLLGSNYGDTDLDRDVDTSDLTKAIMNFTGAAGSGKNWSDGDTDGDSDVDTSDLTKAIMNFTGALAAAANSVVLVGQQVQTLESEGTLSGNQSRLINSETAETASENPSRLAVDAFYQWWGDRSRGTGDKTPRALINELTD